MTLSNVTWDTRRRGGTDHLLGEAAGGGVVYQAVVPQIQIEHESETECQSEFSIESSKGIKGIVQWNQTVDGIQVRSEFIGILKPD